jgi:hypothetical protein
MIQYRMVSKQVWLMPAVSLFIDEYHCASQKKLGSLLKFLNRLRYTGKPQHG